MTRAVLVCALLILIACGGGGGAADTFDAGADAISGPVDAGDGPGPVDTVGDATGGSADAATDGGSSPMDASTPVDLCAGVSCTTAPAATCVGSTQRTYDPIGTCSDGVCSYASNDTACAAGCDNAACIDPCAGVTCTNPPGPFCEGDHLRTYEATGTCSSGGCSYASSLSTCELGCQNTTCFNPDPRLEDPARISLPFECAGTPLTAAQIIEHVAQGGDSLQLINDSRNPLLRVLTAFQTSRTCHPLTGCGAWRDSDAESYLMRFWVSASGELQLIQDDVFFAGHSEIEATITSADRQIAVHDSAHGGTKRQYKLRMTRADQGFACFSAASVREQDPPKDDGSYRELFWIAATTIAAPVPRTTPEPLAPWPFHCAGTPASNAEIASWFPSGQSQLAFRGNRASRLSTQQCHPITGCSPWDLQFLGSPQLQGLKATATSLLLWFEPAVNVPLVDGLVNTTVGAATYTGIAATDKCVSYHRTAVANTPPSAVVITTHTEEQSVAP